MTRSAVLSIALQRSIQYSRTTTSYSDYRTTNGVTAPWHIHVTDGDKTVDGDFVRRSLAIGSPVSPTQFGIPHSSTAFASYGGPVALPAKVIWGFAPNIVVRLNVNGRGLDFTISSDAPQSLIDFDVARELGLPSYGQVTHAANRDPVSYDTLIPKAEIGPLVLRNFVVRAEPFHYHLGGDIKIVGLPGYDVLSSGVFKIDFVNGTVDLTPAKAYEAADPVPHAYVIPIDFDGGHPYFTGLIDNHQTSNIILDNDFDFSFLFGSFTQQYPSSVTDGGGKQVIKSSIPFADSKSFGRNVDLWEGYIPDVKFGPAHFINYRIFASNVPFDYDGRDIGITPTTMTLSRIITLHRVAVGKLQPGIAHTRTEAWTYKNGELSGTQTYVQSGDDYREDTVLGPFHESAGRLHGTQWRQNDNGVIRTLTGLHQRDDVNARALAHAAQPDSGVELLGTVSTPTPAYVVMVSPKGGRTEYVFYDEGTYLIVRTEQAVEQRRVVTTYDDFRVTNGFREAWHIHRSNGLEHDDADWKLQSQQADTSIDPAKLAIPPARSIVTFSGSPVKLPAKISGDRIILTAQMGGIRLIFS